MKKTPNPTIGEKFGRLTVTGEPVYRSRSVYISTTCECGNPALVMKQNLTKGASKSCGCLNAELVGDRRKYPKGSTKTYNIWFAMVSRCTNPKNASYHDYGGRGIKVCDRWLHFPSFWEDMGPAPKGLTIERVRNDDGYQPDNCEWVTRHVNLMNKRTTVRVDYKGASLTMPQLSTICAVPWKNLYQRIFIYGWTVEEAMQPVKFKSKNGQAVWDKRP